MRAIGRRELIALHLRRLWRAIEIAIGIRKVSPRPGELLPSATVAVPELDTGGAWRAPYRPQDPSKDPREPNGSESSSSGTDHGWSNCTMSSGAMALAYHTHGLDDLTPWGGDLRHRQGDLSGGTDLYDLRDAWAEYGETLTIKSGAGWSALADYHAAGRAIVIQGEGNVPGTESFDGGHACCIAPETHSGGDWLFGDPLATGWQWVSPSSIRSWAERWQSSIAFAISRVVVEPEPEPEPPPAPKPPPAPPSYSRAELETAAEHAARLAVGVAADELVGVWVDYIDAPAPGPADVWAAGSWAPATALLDELTAPPDPCEPSAPAGWSRDPLPMPVADAWAALHASPAWDAFAWRAGLWLG